MTDREKHETAKNLKKEGFWFAIIGSLSAIVSGGFFFLGEFGYGLICLVMALILFFMSLLVAIKIHARYTQLLILKLNNKTWEDSCDCYECVQRRESHPHDSVKSES